MQFTCRQANIGDFPQIWDIYVKAQEYMESHGNPQWKKGFPNETDIKGGIYGGILYVVMNEGNICAVFSAVNHDEDYDEIEGEWKTKDNYLAVHHVAVNDKYRGKGAGKYIINKAGAELARNRGRKSLRFDTHEKNIPMQHLLTRCGADMCGYVYISGDGTKRMAYEKVI